MAAPTINLDAYSDALVVLGTAGIVVPLVRRFGLSPVLGYLGAGAILGPLALGSFKDEVPFLRWVTVIDAQNVSVIADLGVVFLLFLIGLELSYERLLTMRRLVFGLGSLQVALSTVVIGSIVALAGAPPAAAVIIGSCLSLSSTAIVIEVLSNQRRMSTATGRTSFSILLAQDMAVVPILMFVSILGNGADGSIVKGLVLAVAQAALALGFIIIFGRLLLRPLFRLVASTGTDELFVAAILFVIVATGVAAGLAGVSMALGAFVAGLLLAETEYRKAIETTIEPFKGLLLGVFFFTVGMTIDFRELAREPALLLISVGALIIGKAALIALLARGFRVPMPAAIETGLLLGPGGEFAFVVIGLAAAFKLVSASTASFTLAVTSLTMALIPLLATAARRITAVTEDRKALDPLLLVAPPPDAAGRAIVVGHGRVGQVVCDLLEQHGVRFISTDRDPATVAQQRRRNREVYYGDAANEAFLKSCGVMDAAGVIVTIHDRPAIDQIVRVVRALRPDIPIVSRARDAGHARHLYAIGVTDAVPETIEASLQLSEAALVGLGVPTGPAIASIHEKRDEFRHELQEAAGKAGVTGTHSIRAKTANPEKAT
ncbi:MAG: cation:proton antiporter [Hyphomonadaceae bacterium]|jgi:CPA2 family monovalent cation:H+ antiporter-2|nr:cation:proton antiporter [Hyphomonadaceae bacterium]